MRWPTTAAAGGVEIMKVVPLRLQPGDDLRLALEAWMVAQQEQAGCVISAVGSLSLAQLRLAGATEATEIRCELEILTLRAPSRPMGPTCTSPSPTTRAS